MAFPKSLTKRTKTRHNLCNAYPFIPSTTMKPSRCGQNYTPTSLIDGFYTNIPLHTLRKCQSLTNQKHNSYHYLVNLTLNFVQLARKSHQSPKHQPKMAYLIPREKIQTPLIKFQEATNLESQVLTTVLQNPPMTPTKLESFQNKFQYIINTPNTNIDETCYLSIEINKHATSPCCIAPVNYAYGFPYEMVRF